MLNVTKDSVNAAQAVRKLTLTCVLELNGYVYAQRPECVCRVAGIPGDKISSSAKLLAKRAREPSRKRN